jgi:hypothetical protein
MPAGGRKPGQKNKITKDMKEVLMLAFERKGGVRYLEKVADTDPKTFCHLLSRIIPVQVAVQMHHIDLGAEMRAAEQRIREGYTSKLQDVTPPQPPQKTPAIIEHEPAKPVRVSRRKNER